jgi:hypothetical protein
VKIKANREKMKSGKSILFRTTEDERKKIEDKAKEYTDGDISKWVRFASLHFVPQKSHLLVK